MEILALTEVLAEHVHSAWMRERLRNGWHYGPMRNDDRKEHPCIVPYEALPEMERECDRRVALATMKAVIALGFEIRKRPSTK